MKLETSRIACRTEWQETTFSGSSVGAERPSPRRGVLEILADCDSKLRQIEARLSHQSEANG